MKNGNLKNHPASEIFPMMQDNDLQELSDDIKRNGLSSPIVLLGGVILDGRNRYRACQMANVDPVLVEYERDQSPVEWVVSQNIHRRHLTASQKAAAAVALLPLLEMDARERKLSKLKQNQDVAILPPRENDHGRAREKAAKLTGASPRNVQDAKKLATEDPEKFEKVKQGQMSIPEAKREIAKEKAKEDPKEQVVDELGNPVPKDCLELWNRGEEVSDLISDIRKLQLKLTSIADSKDPLWARVSWQEVQIQIKRVRSEVSQAVPYAVCPMCQGRKAVKCAMCKGIGYISKFFYDTAVPCELKAMKK